MAALSCLLDSVRRDIRKVDRELRQLKCLDECTRCLCDLYVHPYCCCDLHPYPYCQCYTKCSRVCGLCDLYPYCLCDIKLFCLRPSIRSLERKAIKAILDEKKELTNVSLAVPIDEN
uniref:Outer dense fiber protein 1 n=1 Tax=Sarcophilus harrisii TaxID=9305 RepID=A0A7N4PKL7_SARHA